MTKQKRLPGTEGRIEELQDSAREYADIRDERQALTAREVELRSQLLAQMKKNGKTDYRYEGVEIHVVAEEEKVKVRIHKSED